MSDVVTLPEFKDYLGTELTAKEPWLQELLDTATAAAGTYCQRQFVLAADTATVTRQYVPMGDTLRVHDFVGTATVTQGGATVPAAGYQLEPLNGLTAAGVSVPYEEIVLLNTCWSVTRSSPTISVLARWGWASFPSQVKQAVMMLAKDLRSARDTSYGIAGFTDYAGVRARENLQVSALLADFRRVESWGIG